MIKVVVNNTTRHPRHQKETPLVLPSPSDYLLIVFPFFRFRFTGTSACVST